MHGKIQILKPGRFEHFEGALNFGEEAEGWVVWYGVDHANVNIINFFRSVSSLISFK